MDTDNKPTPGQDATHVISGDAHSQPLKAAMAAELTTSEIADLIYPNGAARPEMRRRRLSDAAKAARRLGVSPIAGRRSGDGQRLWSRAEILSALESRPGRGNRRPR